MADNQAKGNIAYIDAQNLWMATTHGKDPWEVDAYKFRRYLQIKYRVVEAYYFIGVELDTHQGLYDVLKEAGFNLVFREHPEKALSKKKGNVDVDIAFQMLVDSYERTNEYDKALLVSNDGDYFKVIRHLHRKGKLEKVLFPSKRNASSLYNKLSDELFAYLDEAGLKDRLKR